MTSADTFPGRFTRIDELTGHDHWYLAPEDECYFIGEYTAGMGFDYSPTNDMIQNFKKPMNRRHNRKEWQYKKKAIKQVANAFSCALGSRGIEQFTFVPIPPRSLEPIHVTMID